MKTHQKGRSMVEMLGVLAIIGVLSAGALAGYSKAMFRHRVNQTIDIFQNVLQNLAELDEKDWGENAGWIDSAEEIIQYGILPECQKTTDTADAESACQLPIGVLEIEVINDGYMTGVLWFHLTDAKSCVAFASAGWERSVPIDWWNPAGQIIIEGKRNAAIYGPLVNNAPKELNVSQVAEICNESCEDGDCRFTVVIREW